MVDVAAAASAEISSEENRCPHCRGLTRLEEHAFYRWVCGACGGPRVPIDDGRAISTRASAELVRANGARKQSFALRMAAIGLALAGTITAALGALLTIASAAVGVMILLTAAALLVGSVVAGARGKKHSEEARRLTFEAWESVAQKVVELHGAALTGTELAKKMHTTEADVERMMSFLSVDDRVRIDVGADAEVRYASPAVPVEASGARVAALAEAPGAAAKGGTEIGEVVEEPAAAAQAASRAPSQD